MTNPIVNPRISVVLPIRNGMPHLKRTLEGLLSQTYQNFTLLVQDSLSTDGSLEYLRSLNAPFEIDIVSERDNSLVEGYNRAILRAKGDLVVPAACDEAYDPDAFAKFVQWHTTYPAAVFVYGGSRLIAADGTVSPYMPLEFDLYDYLRQRMCPTMAGFFNRSLLADELHLDESLASAPDFELLVRLALKYGQERIVRVEDTTMSARADETSMSFRPSAYWQFGTDKSKVLERLFSGPLKEQFLVHIRNDIYYGLYSSMALAAESLVGDDQIFRDLATRADSFMPGQSRTAYMSTRSRHFEWDHRAQRLKVRSRVAPETVPPEAAIAQKIVAEDLIVYEYWQRAGASVRVQTDGARIECSNIPWCYSAAAKLDYGSVPFDAAFCWLRLTVKDVVGDVRVSLFDLEGNQIFLERKLVERLEVQDILFELDEPMGSTLLFRSGETDSGPCSAVFLGAELLTIPIHAAA